MKKVIAVVLAVVLVLTLPFCAGAEEITDHQSIQEQSGAQEKKSLDDILGRGVLRVGTAGDYQPMSYLDPETNTYVGFDAELADQYIYQYIEEQDAA